MKTPQIKPDMNKNGIKSTIAAWERENRVVISELRHIALDGKPTGFGVTQAKAGTEVYALTGIDAPRLSLGASIQLPKVRYSLASPARRLEFNRDFIATFEARLLSANCARDSFKY
tara:strand:+ start:686 stop:1033 length:348 start_codon:yes stop_codon:yes gene_type:complete